MREKLIYRIFGEGPLLYPDECHIEEEFQENKEWFARVLRQRIPGKKQYVILLQERDFFPTALEVVCNTQSASYKLLEHALNYVQGKIAQNNLPLLIESQIEDHTAYGAEIFNKLRTKIEKNK